MMCNHTPLCPSAGIAMQVAITGRAHHIYVVKGESEWGQIDILFQHSIRTRYKTLLKRSAMEEQKCNPEILLLFVFYWCFSSNISAMF